MDDLISRQAAIDVLGEEPLVWCDGEDEIAERNQWKRDIEAIEQLPPIQPKTGKWILDRSGAYCCSECMEPCAGYVMMKPRDKFCKMCGAKMEVTE